MIYRHKQESRSTYSFETHPMNGTNQLNGTSVIIVHDSYAKVKLKLQRSAEEGNDHEN